MCLGVLPGFLLSLSLSSAVWLGMYSYEKLDDWLGLPLLSL